MAESTNGFDVFLSYSVADAAEGAVVRDKLQEAGLSVFEMEKPSSEDVQWESVRTALTGSEALVLVAQNAAVPPNAAIEVGAAMAWLKPVLLVVDGEARRRLPTYLDGLQHFSLRTLAPLVQAIINSKAELNEDELAWLAEWYKTHSQPLDQILRDQIALGHLDSEFHAMFGRHVANSKLLQALLRLRKRGLLAATREGTTGP